MDNPNALIAVVTTVGTRADAERLADMLVAQGLAACVHIEAIDSVYVWDGALQRDAEHRLLAKTTRERYGAVEAALRAQHPYELPAIYALEVVEAFAPYSAWVNEHCTRHDRGPCVG